MEWVAQLSHLNYVDYVHIWFDIELYFIQLLSFVHYVQIITLWILLLIAFQLSVINFKVNSAAAKLAIFHIRITIKVYHASMSFELLSNLWYRTPTKNKQTHIQKKIYLSQWNKTYTYHMHELHGYRCTRRGNHPSECSSVVPTSPCFCPFYEAIRDTLGFSQPVGAG